MSITSRQEQAKRPVMALAGLYGHPFHPMVVPIPIGAWMASLAFDVGTRLADNPDPFGQGAYWLILLGIVGALAAAALGFLDLFGIPTGTRAFRTGLVHMSLNLVVVGLFAVSALLRHGDHENPGETSAGLIALSILALGLLAISGWLGARLAYRYGVRVADEATQAEGFTDLA
jgi:uncharacterized membrane protein